MGQKRNTTVRLSPDVLLRLKRHALAWNAPIGDVLEGLLDTVDGCLNDDDPAWTTRFAAIYESAMVGAGLDLAFWGDGSPEEEEIKATVQQRRADYQLYKKLKH